MSGVVRVAEVFQSPPSAGRARPLSSSTIIRPATRRPHLRDARATEQLRKAGELLDIEAARPHCRWATTASSA